MEARRRDGMTVGPRPYLWMLAGSWCFATMGALSRHLALQADWRLLALARAALMLGFAVAIARGLRVRFIVRGSPTLWMRSLVGSLGMVCTFYALTHLPISDAITLLNIYPLWVTLLMWIVFKERPTWKMIAAVAMAAAGVWLIARPHFDQASLALGVAIASSFCTAVVMLGLNRLGHLETHAIVVHFAGVSTIVTAAFLLATGTDWSIALMRKPVNAALLLCVGITGTVGQIAMTRAFALGPASRVSVVGLTQLVFGAAYDLFFWRRPFSAWTLCGIALVAAPTAWLLAVGLARRGSPAPPAAAVPAAGP